MQEQRTIPRWKIERPAQLMLKETKRFEDCFIEDMNLKGMKVLLDRELPQENVFRIALKLIQDSPIEIDVTLPWKKEDQGKYVYGVSFRSMRDEDKDRIYQYINSNFFKEFHDHWWQNS